MAPVIGTAPVLIGLLIQLQNMPSTATIKYGVFEGSTMIVETGAFRASMPLVWFEIVTSLSAGEHTLELKATTASGGTAGLAAGRAQVYCIEL
jgi:hypothetical protein